MLQSYASRIRSVIVSCFLSIHLKELCIYFSHASRRAFWSDRFSEFMVCDHAVLVSVELFCDLACILVCDIVPTALHKEANLVF